MKRIHEKTILEMGDVFRYEYKIGDSVVIKADSVNKLYDFNGVKGKLIGFDTIQEKPIIQSADGKYYVLHNLSEIEPDFEVHTEIEEVYEEKIISEDDENWDEYWDGVMDYESNND